MKKLIALIPVLALCFACSDSDEYEYYIPSLELSKLSLFFESGGGEQAVTVGTNIDEWTIAQTPEWITPVKSGNVITFGVAPYDGVKRTSYVYVSGAETRDSVYIYQIGSDAEDLSSNGTANSYIAKPGGNYYFNATVKGNGSEITAGVLGKYNRDYGIAITGAQYADIMWTATFDRDRTRSHNILAAQPVLRDGRIYFSTGDYEGNALIAAKTADGRVLWSWHIWVVGNDVAQVEGNGLRWMDRNLGALSNTPDAVENRGLCYQWGRKDPFLPTYLPYDEAILIGAAMEQPVNEITGRGNGKWRYTDYVSRFVRIFPGNLIYAQENPMTFIINYGGMGSDYVDWFLAGGGDDETYSYLWGDADGSLGKTIFDPCPPGYVIPTASAWGTTLQFTADAERYGSYWSVNGQFYPYAGYLIGYRGYPAYTANRGLYWTRTPYTGQSQGFYLHVENDGYAGNLRNNRAQAATIRCVAE